MVRAPIKAPAGDVLFASWLAYDDQIEGTDVLNPVITVEAEAEHE